MCNHLLKLLKEYTIKEDMKLPSLHKVSLTSLDGLKTEWVIKMREFETNGVDTLSSILCMWRLSDKTSKPYYVPFLVYQTRIINLNYYIIMTT